MTPARAGHEEPHAVEEPDALCCPITHCMLRDPVFVPESGTTYEREALLNFWHSCRGRRRDVLSNQPVSSDTVYVDWNKRREVAAWLSANPSHTPEGWPDATQPPAAAAAAATRRWMALRMPGLGRAPSLRGCLVVLVVATALGGGLATNLLPESLEDDASSAPRPWPQASRLESDSLDGVRRVSRDRAAHRLAEDVEHAADSTAQSDPRLPESAGPAAQPVVRLGRVRVAVEGPVLHAHARPATLGATLGGSFEQLVLAAGWLGFVAFWTGGAHRTDWELGEPSPGPSLGLGTGPKP